MEPNLLPESLTTTLLKVNKNFKGHPQAELKTCSEITIKQFLDFLKTAYQVQESLEGVLKANGMTEAIDWLKLKESQFVKRNETCCQTIESIGAVENDNKDKKKIDCASSKSSHRLQQKLGEVISEGLLDSILPFVVSSHSQNYQSRKTSLNKITDKSSTSSTEKLRKKSNELIVVKTPCIRTPSQVEIHVCDEVKNMKRNFFCNQKLLVEKMGYFAEVTAGQKLEDMDISVHCDVGIFEWLMNWVQKDSSIETDWPQLDPQCVVPILVSAAFLQMEPLLEECLRYCHENMNDVLRTSTNLSCLNDSILTRLAAMYTNSELEDLRDRKDKLQSRLFTKLLMSLTEPEPEAVRGHWSSLARVYRCEKCQQIVSPAVALRIPCCPSCMRLQYDGSIISHHVRDPTWNINEHIEKLYKNLKSWRKVYWRLWGNAHFLYCLTCKRFFPANQLGWCRFHPDAPQFFTLDAQKAPLPVGRYPCCGERAYKFQLLTNFCGCQFREHIVCTKDVKDSEVFAMLGNYRHLVVEEPPQLMFPERLTRLVARDASANDKLVCKESFWWDGLEIIPPRPKFGLLDKFAERDKGNNLIDAKCDRSSDEESEEEKSSQSTDSDSSSSSEESSIKPARSIPMSPRKRKKVKKKGCRLWQVHLSARANQDVQRAYEEKALKQMSNILNRKTCPMGGDFTNKHQKYGRLVHKNVTPLGGIWVRLESEFKEQLLVNGTKTRSNTTATYGRILSKSKSGRV